jgi:hypothetical protein
MRNHSPKESLLFKLSMICLQYGSIQMDPRANEPINRLARDALLDLPAVEEFVSILSERYQKRKSLKIKTLLLDQVESVLVICIKTQFLEHFAIDCHFHETCAMKLP